MKTILNAIFFVLVGLIIGGDVRGFMDQKKMDKLENDLAHATMRAYITGMAQGLENCVKQTRGEAQ